MCSFPTPERYLCSQSATRRVFTVDEALGEPVEVFESRLTDSTFNGIITCFVKWLYGFSRDNGEWVIDRWCLGDKPGSLRLQNAPLRCFCERPDDYKEGDINSTISESAGGDIEERTWDQADFTNDLDKVSTSKMTRCMGETNKY
jgi:hypothetical protein